METVAWVQRGGERRCLPVPMLGSLFFKIRRANMAADLMARLGAGMERWLLLLANGAQFARATRVEHATAWHIDGAGNLALQADTLLYSVPQAWHCREQSRCIGVMGS